MYVKQNDEHKFKSKMRIRAEIFMEKLKYMSRTSD
jgi:hypothetical protein